MLARTLFLVIFVHSCEARQLLPRTGSPSQHIKQCSLFLEEEFQDCIVCEIKSSTKEKFEENFGTNLSADWCQAEVSSELVDVATVADSTSEVSYIIMSLHTARNTIHTTKEIIFKIIYYSLLEDILVDVYYEIHIDLKGRHRKQLANMRIPLRVNHPNLNKDIIIQSHSRNSCGGLFSSHHIEPQHKKVWLVEVIEKSKEECVYVELHTVSSNEEEQPKPNHHTYQRSLKYVIAFAFVIILIIVVVVYWWKKRNPSGPIERATVMSMRIMSPRSFSTLGSSIHLAGDDRQRREDGHVLDDVRLPYDAEPR